MPKYYFFQTLQEGSRNRLRALPGQITTSGVPLDTKLNAAGPSGSKTLREQEPIGTVFATSSVQMQVHANKNSYTVGPLISLNRSPKPEVLSAYTSYLTNQNMAQVSKDVRAFEIEERWRFLINKLDVGPVKFFVDGKPHFGTRNKDLIRTLSPEYVADPAMEAFLENDLKVSGGRLVFLDLMTRKITSTDIDSRPTEIDFRYS